MAITRAQQYRQMLKDGEVAIKDKAKYKDQRLTKTEQKKAKAVNSAGIKNYLNKQETVTVPKKWLSSPDHVIAELAYITPREQKILLDADLYDSLNGEPNRGPGGIMSLQGAGDGGGVESDGKGGHTGTGGGSGGSGPGPQGNFRETSNITNTTGGQRATGPTFSVATGADGKPFTGGSGSGGENDPDDQVEKDLQDFYNKKAEYPKYVPSFVKFLGNINRKPNRDFFVNKVLRAGKIPGVDYDDIYDDDFDLEGEYQDYMDNRMAGKTDAYGNPTEGFSYGDDGGLTGNFMNNGGGDNNQTYVPPIIPPVIPEDGTEDEVVVPDRNLGGLAARIAGSKFDFTGLADGGRAGAMDGGRMMQMDMMNEEDDPVGGIMDLETLRNQYFFGGIVKSAKKAVKSATRAVKKVAKSPIGKIALGYALTGGLSNMAAGRSFGANFFSPSSFISKGGIRNIFTKGGAKNILFGGQKLMGNPAKNNFVDFSGILGSGGKASLAKMVGIPTALSYFMTPKEEEEKVEGDVYGPSIDINAIRNSPYRYLTPRFTGSKYEFADGGRTGYAEGSEEPVAKKTMPLLDMEGQEMDLREEGGFVPLGRMEKADDVPARLSKNEFVFTADAVRNAGEGDVDKGAEVMYNMMKNLESGGEVSEESQGLEGAREMFKTSQRLEEVI